MDLSKRISVCFVCAVLSLVVSTAAMSALRPDLDFVTAALKQQEVSSGASLRVRYAVNPLVQPKTRYQVEDVVYIRTPDVLYKEVTYWRVSETGERKLHRVTKFRYDRKTGAYKSLATFAGSDLHIAYVLTSKALPSRFVGSGVIDPVLFWTTSGPLVSVMRECSVVDGQDDIAGHQCWQLDIAKKRIGPESSGSWSFWLDPEFDYCPRRIVEKINSNTFTTDFSDYKAIGEGVYFPMSVEMKYDSSGQSGIKVDVQEAKSGETFAPKDLDFEFPSGTTVYAVGQGVSYTVP